MLNLRIIKSYNIDGSRVIDGVLPYQAFGKFKNVQIALSDKITIGFPTIINGFWKSMYNFF